MRHVRTRSSFQIPDERRRSTYWFCVRVCWFFSVPTLFIRHVFRFSWSFPGPVKENYRKIAKYPGKLSDTFVSDTGNFGNGGGWVFTSLKRNPRYVQYFNDRHSFEPNHGPFYELRQRRFGFPSPPYTFQPIVGHVFPINITECQFYAYIRLTYRKWTRNELLIFRIQNCCRQAYSIIKRKIRF